MARILIIDDSPTEIHVLRTMLEKNGYSVSTAASGEEGVETARAQVPDLVLMDVVMPGLNGFQATRELSKQEETANVPVVVVSTKDQATDRVWAMRQGARDYITKPVTEDTLLQTIEKYLSA
ncbi:MULTISPECIES: response regulator [Thioalkalivibrio]|uniref:Response regulator n=1 Tax=Thioalkalivibrio halophilus TaxID=252474 RepID=A0A1V2ZVX8_9GAMM|nr:MULTISPECIES: response regulator [Thioalkalivibrio]OOC09216.1 response regulator [Thioalkalivibrio halophilus]PYG03299.1 twitching motility two-component system response regulator PilH [Thioalkalivibrio sp. ALE21]